MKNLWQFLRKALIIKHSFTSVLKKKKKYSDKCNEKSFSQSKGVDVFFYYTWKGWFFFVLFANTGIDVCQDGSVI